MKKKEIFEMTTHLDEKYILEAASEPKKNIKLKKRIITFAVAAALTATMSIGAFAAYKALNRESVGTFYESSAMDEIERKGYVSNQITENEHFRMTLDTAIKDDYNFLAVVTVKALDSYAEQYLEKLSEIATDATYSDTGEKLDGFAFLTGVDTYQKGKEYSMRLNVPVNTVNGSVDLSRPIHIEMKRDERNKTAENVDLFKGLNFDLKDIKQSKSVKFSSPSGDVLNVSELEIAIETDKIDVRKDESEISNDTFESINNISIHYKDGTTQSLSEKINIVAMYLTKDDRTVIIIDLRVLIDPDTIDYIEYIGSDFRAK